MKIQTEITGTETFTYTHKSGVYLKSTLTTKKSKKIYLRMLEKAIEDIKKSMK